MHNNPFLGFLVLGLLTFNSGDNFSNDLGLRSQQDTSDSYVLIVSAIDLKAQKMRQNKKALFAELISELKIMIEIELNKRSNAKIEIINEFILVGEDEIFKLMKERNANKAIVINQFDVFFNQVDVEVSSTPEGKTRVARYDICSDITYLEYRATLLVDSSTVHECEFYSNRTVASGLLAAGPSIVSNKKEALHITRRNVEKYFYNFHSK